MLCAKFSLRGLGHPLRSNSAAAYGWEVARGRDSTNATVEVCLLFFWGSSQLKGMRQVFLGTLNLPPTT